MSLYLLTVTVHLLAAVFWLGGMFFFAAVGAPALRRIGDDALRASLFETLGKRFRTAGWWAIAVLVVTGIVNLYFRGLLVGEVWASTAFWRTPYGKLLAAKLLLVAAMLALQSVHDFALGPRASRAVPGSAAAGSLRRRASWLARVTALLGVVLLYVAVRLVRG